MSSPAELPRRRPRPHGTVDPGTRLHGQRAADHEHGAAAPVGPRRVPRRPDARRRDGRRRRRRDRLPAPLPREAGRDADLRAVPVDRVEDRLRRGDDERAGLRDGRRADRRRSTCRSGRSTCGSSSPNCSASPRTACGSAPGAWTWAARSAAARRSFSTASASASWCSTCSRRWSARGCSTAFTRSAASATTCRPAGRPPAARRSTVIEQRVGEYEAMLEENPFFLMRTAGRRRHLARGGARRWAISGPLLRGSGVAFDIRRAEPVFVVRRLRRSTCPSQTAGDCFARYRVRMAGVPPGDRPSCGRRSTACPRARSRRARASSRSCRSGFPRARPTRASRARAARWAATWSPTAAPKPYRMKWRGASFSNLAVLPHIIPGHKVADVVAIMGSVDPVFGEVDR